MPVRHLPHDRLGPVAILASSAYVAVTGALLFGLAQQQQASRAPFLVVSVLAGMIIGRWGAAFLPVLCVGAYLALGLPAAPGDALEVTLVAGTIFGVALRRTGGEVSPWWLRPLRGARTPRRNH